MKLISFFCLFTILILTESTFAQGILWWTDDVPIGDIPSYESVGAIDSDDDTVNVAYPAGIEANDILILQTTMRDGGAGDPIVEINRTDWTIIDSVYDASNSAYFYVFWKRAIGDESGTLEVAQTNGPASIYGIISRWSGCVTSGTPYESLVSSDYETTDSIPANAITTLGDNRLAVCIVNLDDNNTLGAMSNYTEHYDVNSASPNPGAGFVGLSLDVPTASTTSLDEGTSSGVDRRATFTFALKPTGS